ncbi:MAG TPA: alcohol dehydrogenase catalytic domain-containing protein [Acidimicrobiia bacterium]|nr:alcohol dehydrogenase catalytic domain-containing protein [Acidimicrobiia bacterium]
MADKTMQAIVLEEYGGPLVMREIPLAEPGPGEVLVRVRACAVDRFDTAIRAQVRERGELPLILGHEIAGEVAAAGPGVEGWSEGDRVVTSLYLTCGRCRWCRRGRETICENFAGHIGVNSPGGYAEYTVLPAKNLVSVPGSIDFPAASLLANVVGTPFHALTRRMRLAPAEYLAVTGGGGGVGLHAIQLGRMLGARVMGIDLGEAKQEAMRRAGAETTVDPERQDLGKSIRDWNGRGLDGVLELVGPATMPATLEGLAKGGRMVIVGSHTGGEWTIDPGLMYRNEWEILGSRNVTVDELATVVELVDAGHVEPIIDQTRPLEGAEELHARVLSGQVIGRDILLP